MISFRSILLNPTTPASNKAIKAASRKISNKYEQVKPELSITKDAQLNADLKKIGVNKQERADLYNAMRDPDISYASLDNNLNS